MGHRVTIVTSKYNYLTAAEKQDSERQSFASGIDVRLAPTLGGLHRSYLSRVFVFLSFMFSSVAIALWLNNVDIVLGTSPPIFQAVSAWIAAAIRRRPFVLEVRDLWPEFAIDLGLLQSRCLIALARQIEEFLYNRAHLIIVNSPAYRIHLAEKGIPEGKVCIIANGVDVSMFDPDQNGRSFRREHGLCEKIVVMYAGALGFANPLDTLLHAALRLRDQPEIVLVIVGCGKEATRLRRESDAMSLHNVRFVPAQPKARIPEILAAADICVATPKNVPMFQTTYPNKVFDYMAAGRPTVLAIDGVIREVIENSRGGLFVPPEDDDPLAMRYSHCTTRLDCARNWVRTPGGMLKSTSTATHRLANLPPCLKGAASPEVNSDRAYLPDELGD
ncbi:MAG TPA: glycosyltransferase family 4 protein [Terriglobales bacterium]|nr:glycosyltransferase family 4 protein [Terriglobales bacterium]